MDLYDNKDHEIHIDQIEDFFEDDPQDHPLLSTDQISMLNQDITMKELELALKSTKNQSSPGTTGFTYPFYKVFWS